jgi:hypothetical protein
MPHLPDHLQRVLPVGRQRRKYLLCTVAVCQSSRMRNDLQHIAEGVSEEVTLASIDFLAAVKTAVAAALGRLGTLAVNHAAAGMRQPLLALALEID